VIGRTEVRDATARSGAQGFTLLEMVLSLTIVGLIVALVGAGFNVAGTAIGGGERAAEQSQRIRLTADILMRQIKSTALFPARDDDYEYPFFKGTRQDLAFVTAAAQSGGGGLAVVTYRVQGNPPSLVLSESADVNADILGNADRLDEMRWQHAVLLQGFTDLYFRYLVSDGVETEWFDAWDGKDEEELPAAVQVVIEGLAGLGGGTWTQNIPLVIATFSEVQPDLGDAVPGGEGNEQSEGNEPGEGNGPGGGNEE
jgi:general secretion pathway protein J